MSTRSTSQHRFGALAAAVVMSLAAVVAAVGPATTMAARPFVSSSVA